MDAVESKKTDVHKAVSEYYGKDLSQTSDLATCGCVSSDEDKASAVQKLLENVHEEIKSRYYGCGSPLPVFVEGCTVLDLGCGTGRDVYCAAQLVGEMGHVIGVDMTEEQLEVARKHEDWQRQRFGFLKSNVDFKKALLEDMHAAVADDSVDVAISNCVINLCPSKEAVFREIMRVLKPGGELFFSDVFTDRRIPEELSADKVLLGECLAGAHYIGDFLRLLRRVGFLDVRVVASREMPISTTGMFARLKGIRFFSNTVRAFKLPSLEDAPEDYGQVAVYKGGIPGHEAALVLDRTTYPFIVDHPVRVDGNVARILMGSRFESVFRVSAPGPHQGVFEGSLMTTQQAFRGGSVFTAPSATGACNGGGGCCGGSCSGSGAGCCGGTSH